VTADPPFLREQPQNNNKKKGRAPKDAAKRDALL
jgi:hypothetical protein